MRQHGALGHAGGAAGVLQHGHVAADRVSVADRLTASLGEHVVEFDRLWQVIRRDHFLHVLDDAVDQQALERRQQVRDFGDDHMLDGGLGHDLFRQVSHVGQADQRLGAGIVELVFHFPRGVQRVGVDHNQAGADGTEHSDWVLQNVG